MQISNLPATKLPLPFGASAGAGYIRTIPVASQIGIQDGAASLTDGFPPLNFSPVGSGGVPPFGQDMNGILFEISAWTRWQNAGGLVPYDSAFSGQIGGYPQGAVLAGTTAGTAWLSTVDNNVTNPNTGGAGWVLIATAPAVQAGSWNYAAAGGTANALTATLSPVPAALTTGLRVTLKIATTNTGAATLNLNGLGAVAIIKGNGQPLVGGELQAGRVLSLSYDGSSWQMQALEPGLLLNIQVFDTVGAATYTPTPGTNRAIVDVQGAGGQGGGSPATAAGQLGFGTGGHSGARAVAQISLVGVSSVAVTVGAAGTGGAAGASGGTGGTSSFGAFITCPGGAGGGVLGPTSSSFVGANAVAPPSPTISGVLKTIIAQNGNSGNPIICVNSGSAISGTGGMSPAYSGATGTGRTGTQAGASGSQVGAGGSGAFTAASGAAQVGGDGARGQIVVYEYS